MRGGMRWIENRRASGASSSESRVDGRAKPQRGEWVLRRNRQNWVFRRRTECPVMSSGVRMHDSPPDVVGWLESLPSVEVCVFIITSYNSSYVFVVHRDRFGGLPGLLFASRVSAAIGELFRN